MKLLDQLFHQMMDTQWKKNDAIPNVQDGVSNSAIEDVGLGINDNYSGYCNKKQSVSSCQYK